MKKTKPPPDSSVTQVPTSYRREKLSAYRSWHGGKNYVDIAEGSHYFKVLKRILSARQ